MTLDQKMEILGQTQVQPVDGDGKAVFIEYGNDEEFDEYVKMEEKGWKGFYKKIFNINKDETDNK